MTKKKTIDEIKNNFIKVHGNKYDYSRVEYVNNRTNVKIVCPQHGEFEQTPSNHVRGANCYYCSIIICANNRRSNTSEFVNRAIEIHGNRYNYSKVEYFNALSKVIIICPIDGHGEFEQQPNDHLFGHGCKKCGIEDSKNKQRKTNNKFIEDANKIHNNKYDYSLIEYVNSHSRLLIKCPIHDIFEQNATCHLVGQGCKECANKLNTIRQTCDSDDFIEKSITKHGNKYDYSKVEYINNLTPVIIICPTHKEFNQKPCYHLQSNGCPKCNNHGYSKAQIKWLNFIQIKDNICIQHAENSNEYQIPTTNFKADGYCKETNTIYEFHGDYWHGNPNIYHGSQFNKTTKRTFGELYQSTISKEQQIKDMGFNLITIWESDWIKLNKCIRVLQRKYRSSKH